MLWPKINMDYVQVSLSGFLNVDAVSQNALSIFQVPAHSCSPGKCTAWGNDRLSQRRG